MTKYELDIAEHQLAELGVILRAWENSRGSDSVRTQDFRQREFLVGERIANNLIYGVQPEHKLLLTVGDNPIEGYRFSKGVYGFSQSSSVELESREQLQLKEANPYWSRTANIEPSSCLYVGYLVLVSLETVAKTLTEGGELSIVKAKATEKKTTVAAPLET